MNQLIYTIIFQDNTKYVGGNSYFETKWKGIPSDKKIKRIFYRLLNNDYICLNNYTNYYHIVEAVQDLNGKRKGEVRIEYAYILGLKDNKITSYRITLFNEPSGRYKIGDIVRREFDINSKFIKGLNKDFWRPLLNEKA